MVASTRDAALPRLSAGRCLSRGEQPGPRTGNKGTQIQAEAETASSGGRQREPSGTGRRETQGRRKDVDRNVYDLLDLRIARHPSETVHYLLTRTIAYCLFYQVGIAFAHGLSEADEPAVWVKDRQGNIALWLDVGSPTAERLHRASKAAPRVVVFTHHDPEILLKQLRGRKIHRQNDLEIFALSPRFLDSIAPGIERHTRFGLVRNDGELYVTIAGRSTSDRLTRYSIEDG